MNRVRARAKFNLTIIKQALLRAILGIGKTNRDEGFVRDVYEKTYGNLSEKNLENAFFKQQKMFLNNKLIVRPIIDYKKFLIGKFGEIISAHKIKSLLELGSGRGINILAIAIIHPNIKKLRGVELTATGVAEARYFLANPPLGVLRYLTAADDATITERLKNRDIDFIQGSIRDLPFAEGDFEGIFSNSVIEQFPQDYLRVFNEVKRLAPKIAFFSEPFYEANNLLKRMYLRNIDYFCAAYREVKKAGFKIYKFEVPEMQKFVFKTGILTCL